MSAVVIYKSRYGSTKQYAQWIAEELSCEAKNAKDVKIDELLPYDTVIYGGGLYAEVINGVSLITKNTERLEGKRLIVYTVGITPLDCRGYYDGEVTERNFKPEIRDRIRVFNFLGKMKTEELTLPHRAALKALKKIMAGKENPTEMERLLVELCDFNGDLTDRSAIRELVAYAKEA